MGNNKSKVLSSGRCITDDEVERQFEQHKGTSTKTAANKKKIEESIRENEK